MKRAVCLQHVPFEGPGIFSSTLQECGFDVETHLVPESGLPAGSFDFLLVMGGPMSVNDSDEWIKAETAFIRQAVERGTPYLGICLGSQFLAKACGGSVVPGDKTEVGMTSITLTEAGQQDPVLSCLPQTPYVMEWHGEAVRAPDKATVLASSEHFDVQAFRIGTKAYGLLFHLELEAAGLDQLCVSCESDLLRAGTNADTVKIEAREHMKDMQGMARTMLKQLCSLR